MPRRTFDRYHRACWIRKEIIRQVWHERDRVRKSRLEELGHGCGRIQLREAVVPFERQKQNARKRPIDIRQSDEHKVPTRPDMQGMGLKYVLSPRTRRNRQFFVSIVEILLREVEPVQLQHRIANG